MRIQLAESSPDSGPPPALLTTSGPNESSTLDVDYWRGIGYTKYDCIVIGAAGGQGGTYFWERYTNGTHSWGELGIGGGGAGGGVHRVKGLLSALPSSLTMFSGAKGGNGAGAVYPHTISDINDTSDASDGTFGGASYLGTVVQASGGGGGEGGNQTDETNPIANGGLGGAAGIGNSRTARGVSGGNSIKDNGPGTSPTVPTSVAGPGSAGQWIDGVGGGSGGGGGGSLHWNGSTVMPAFLAGVFAGPGNIGAYNVKDQSVADLVVSPVVVQSADLTLSTYHLTFNAPVPIIPGQGAGAQATPLTYIPNHNFGAGDPDAYSGDGMVAILMT